MTLYIFSKHFPLQKALVFIILILRTTLREKQKGWYDSHPFSKGYLVFKKDFNPGSKVNQGGTQAFQ
jgi:hypothetical protein